MPSNLQPILFLVLIAAVFYLLMIRPQQKKRKEMQSMLQALRPGSEIVTTAGMFGKVVAMEGDDALLIEVAPGVTCKYMRQSVMRVVTDPAPAVTEPAVIAESSNGTAGDKTDKSDSGAAPTVKDEPKDEPPSTVTKDESDATEASDADAPSDATAKDADDKGSGAAGDRKTSS